MTANEKEISVIAGASFFIGRSDLYPARGAGSCPEQTKESATEETESTTETESETPTETETESETETEETTEEETEGPGDPVDREKVETHLIIASDTHYMSPSMTDYGAAFDSLVNSNDGKVIRYQPQLWQAFKSEVLAANPDALILSGDLSLNGEKANHLEFPKSSMRSKKREFRSM